MTFGGQAMNLSAAAEGDGIRWLNFYTLSVAAGATGDIVSSQQSMSGGITVFTLENAGAITDLGDFTGTGNVVAMAHAGTGFNVGAAIANAGGGGAYGSSDGVDLSSFAEGDHGSWNSAVAYDDGATPLTFTLSPDSQNTTFSTGISVAAIPEPATMGMMAVVGGLALFIRRRLFVA